MKHFLRFFCTLAILNNISSCGVNLPISIGQGAALSFPSPLDISQSSSAIQFSDSFDHGLLSQWETYGNPVTSDEAHEGTQAIQLDQSSGLKTVIPTEAGFTYKATLWIKISSESGDDWGGFCLQAQNIDFEVIANTEWLLQSNSGEDWFKTAITFQAESDQTRLFIGHFGGPARKMVALVDDLKVYRKGENDLPLVQAKFNAASITGLPLDVSYAVTGDDPDGAIQKIVWDFGDGSRSFTASGTHRVTTNGSFTATVKIVDDDGGVVEYDFPWSAQDPSLPSLTVDDLPTTTDQSSITVTGSTRGEIQSVLISTDRGSCGSASGTDEWQAAVDLAPGWNRTLIQAADTQGRLASKEVMIRYVPEGALLVSTPVPVSATVEKWDIFEAAFQVLNSAATDTDYPYDPDPPAGLSGIDGISVDVSFTPDDWKTVYQRSAYYSEYYTIEDKDGAEWILPQNTPAWHVRFSPPAAGTWKYRIEVTEARGHTVSPDYEFSVTQPTSPQNHGPIAVSKLDSRYFEFADQTTFMGSGYNLSFSAEGYSVDALEKFRTIGTGNENLFRVWLGGGIWGSAWQPWSSMTLPYEGYLPSQGFSLDSAYGDGLASFKLDDENPVLIQGWNTGHASVIPGQKYRLLVRWRTEGVTGPQDPSYPYGLTIKFADWPEPGTTLDLAPLIPHVRGDTPWHVSTAEYTAESNFLPNIALLLENTTGGAAYIDEVALYAVSVNGSLGEQVLRSSMANSHLQFDQQRAAGLDRILEAANQNGLYLKLVISEKNEYLLNHLGADGLADPNGENFFNLDRSPGHWLHQAYWRYLFARFGAYRSVHSWELVNEASPDPGSHFALTNDLAIAAGIDGNPHMASISTWATLAEETWKNPAYSAISYTDFHTYINTKDNPDLAKDTVAYFNDYAQQAAAADFGKPVVWGEMGVISTGSSDEEEKLSQDKDGTWLHKLLWAQTGSTGVYLQYWYGDNIFQYNLHPVFAVWNQFMSGIPLSRGNYKDAAASASDPALRVFGQKNLADGKAYLWIDNATDTWSNRVDGLSISPLSGQVEIQLAAQRNYQLAWYDTYSGEVKLGDVVASDSAGNLTITIYDLQTDIAVKIDPVN